MSETPDDISAMAVAGALSTNYSKDARTFLPLLAAVLEASMPDETEIEYKTRLFSKDKSVRKVKVSVSDNVYEIEDPGNGKLAALRVQVVRNIVLKREPMHIDKWLSALSTEIHARAQTNEKAFFALKNMLDYQ